MDRFRLKCAALATALGLSMAWAAKAHADVNDLVAYGVNGQTGELTRYNFATQTHTTVGPIVSAKGAAFTGIEALAHIPGHTNIVGFWNNPSDGMTRLVYINAHHAKSFPIGNHLGTGVVTGATTGPDMDIDRSAMNGDANKGHGNDCNGYDNDNTGNSTGVNVNGQGKGAHAGGCGPVTTMSSNHVIYAVQAVEAIEDEQVDFVIEQGHVIPSEPFVAKVQVLGAAISNGGAYDMPVTVRIKVGDTVIEPFGSYGKALTGNVNDNQNPRSHVLPGTYQPGTGISVVGKSWIKSDSRSNGNSNNHWNGYIEVDAGNGGKMALVLRDGDSVPNITPFMNQSSVASFVKDFVDPNTRKIVLDENQAIYLFELGTTNLSSAAADFQDLVVLVTLGKNVSDLTDADDDDADAGPSSRLIKVDHKTGGYTQLMTLARTYDGLASTMDGKFVANAGNDLYLIDPAMQTETLIGTANGVDMKTLEYAAGILLSADRITGKYMTLATDGGVSATHVGVSGATDLRSIVIFNVGDLPGGTNFD